MSSQPGGPALLPVSGPIGLLLCSPPSSLPNLILQNNILLAGNAYGEITIPCLQAPPVSPAPSPLQPPSPVMFLDVVVRPPSCYPQLLLEGKSISAHPAYFPWLLLPLKISNICFYFSVDHILNPNAQHTKPFFRAFLRRKEVNNGGGVFSIYSCKGSFPSPRWAARAKTFCKSMLKVPTGLKTIKSSLRGLS